MSTRNRLLLDVALFAAIVIAYAPSATGISVHEWLALAIVVPTLLHLVLNWDWVVRSASKLIDRLSTVSRLNLVVDVALFVAAVTVTVSGFMVSQAISTALGISVTATALWASVHSFSADATMLLLFAHFALHAKWMARVLQSNLSRLDAETETAPTSIR